MDDELVERLLQELVETRKSFDGATQTFMEATKQIKWNRINTFIQYGLLAIVMVMLVFGVVYYLDEKEAACERGNELRVAIDNSLDSNAASIGIALTIVTNSPRERFEEYMDAYNQQSKPAILEARDC